MNRNAFDRKQVAIIAGAVLALVLAMIASTIVRAAIVVPLVLVLPGYALSVALFPQRSLGWAERTLLSLGLSFAVLALGSLVLHWTGIGLNAGTWTVLLATITLLSGGIALGRDQVRVSWPTYRSLALTRQQATLFGAAALVTVSAFGVSVWSTAQQPRRGFAEVWLVPANGTDTQTLRIGVNNQEAVATSYRLELQVGGQTVQAWQQLELAPYATWETDVTIDAPGTAEAVLYRSDAPTSIYRRAQLLLDNGSQATLPAFNE